MLKMTEAGKQKVFAEDLAMIQSDEIRNFTIQVMATFPEHFWIQPGSSTGLYHPACTLVKSGLLVHIKRVVFFGKKLIRAHGWNIPSDKADRIISAMILHDGQKGGRGYGPYQNYENHPLLVQLRYYKSFSKNSEEVQIPPSEEEEWKVDIWQMIRFHMGPWSPKKAQKPLDKYSKNELIVYHADYLAAQKDLVTPVDYEIGNLELEYLETQDANFTMGE